MGEKLDDIEPFHPERMASRILGMGDVLTLIEKAQNALDEKKADEMLTKMKQNSFDMNEDVYKRQAYTEWNWLLHCSRKR